MARIRTSKIWEISVKDLKEIVSKEKTYKAILGNFGLKNKGSNFRTLKKRFVQEGIDFSHLSKHGQNLFAYHKKIPIEELLVVNSGTNRNHLKKRLLKENLLENKCSECGHLPMWNNKPLVLQLDHINGVSDDNRIENLRILCPHCHSQTSTFAGRSNRIHPLPIPLAPGQKRKRQAGKRPTKIVWPPVQELQQLVDEIGYVKTGKRLGVSDNSIRKRIKTRHEDK